MRILAVALHKNGAILGGSYELISAAKSVGGELLTAVLAGEGATLAAEVAKRGGGKVLAVSHPVLANYNDVVYARVCSALVTKYSPSLVLVSANNYGKALLPRLAARLGGAMISDATNLQLEGDRLIVTRPSYGGSVIAKLVLNGAGPLFVGIRGKIYPESKEGAGEVVAEQVDPSCFDAPMTVKEVRVEGGGKVSLSDADIIVSAGRGLKDASNLPLVQELADSLGAAMGASRAIVDAGWIPYSHQVGQTGKTVNPKLYFAVGISGAIQHLVGMRSSQAIVAVNKDKDAPIFNVANFGIVGDALEIVPALTKKFKAEMNK